MTRIKALANAAVQATVPLLANVAAFILWLLLFNAFVGMLNDMFPYAEGLQFGEQRAAEHALWLLGTAGLPGAGSFSW